MYVSLACLCFDIRPNPGLVRTRHSQICSCRVFSCVRCRTRGRGAYPPRTAEVGPYPDTRQYYACAASGWKPELTPYILLHRFLRGAAVPCGVQLTVTVVPCDSVWERDETAELVRKAKRQKYECRLWRRVGDRHYQQDEYADAQEAYRQVPTHHRY